MLRRCKNIIALLAMVMCGCDPAFDPPEPTSLGGLRGLYSGYPAYIPRHQDARNLIRRFERDEIMEELLKSYLSIDESGH